MTLFKERAREAVQNFCFDGNCHRETKIIAEIHLLLEKEAVIFRFLLFFSKFRLVGLFPCVHLFFLSICNLFDFCATPIPRIDRFNLQSSLNKQTV